MNIIYTGLFAYPDSNANSLRVKGVVNLLESYGHNVTILPGLKSKIDINKIGSTEVVPVDEYSSGFLSGINGVRGMFIGDNTLDYLEKMIKKPDVIILYGTALGYLLRLLRFTKKYNIRLILDVVEWYDPRHLPGGLFGPYAIANELSMRFFVKKTNGLIVISEYLRKYYEDSNNKIILLPPLFSKVINVDFNRQKNDVLQLCYVGTPGKKENFIVFLDALDFLYKNDYKFKINFVGVKREEFISKYPKVKFINDKDYCFFHGRVSNEKAKQIISLSDFMFVFRPNLRFANAGFPSKVAESLSLATPVFCNNFSDISKYVTDGYNGIVVERLETNSLIEKLKWVFSISNQSYSVMRKNAYSSYEKNFNQTAYLEKMEIFLKGVC